MAQDENGMRVIGAGSLAMAAMLLVIPACSSYSDEEGSSGEDDAVVTGVARTALRVAPSSESIASPHERRRMAQYIKNRVDPDAVRFSFRLGPDWVDCIDIEKQLALRDSGLTAAEIPRAPAGFPLPPELPTEDTAPSTVPATQLGENGETCPQETVPRLRFEIEQLSRFPTLEAWLTRKAPPQDATAAGHEYNMRRDIVNNIGAGAIFNGWQPGVQSTGEMSVVQFWIVGCDIENNVCPAGTRQTIEAGLTAYNDVVESLPDDSLRLLIYSTPNDYATSCWNDECGQFVQTDFTHTLGGTFSPLSVFGSTQYELQMFAYREPTSPSHWWVQMGGTWIGYYKNNDAWFDSPGLEDDGEYWGVGGEIADVLGGGHTTTDMGSGKCPSSYSGTAKFGQVAFIRNIGFINTSNAFGTVSFDLEVNNSPYKIGAMNDPYGSGSSWGQHFFYGGPGDTACP